MKVADEEVTSAYGEKFMISQPATRTLHGRGVLMLETHP